MTYAHTDHVPHSFWTRYVEPDHKVIAVQYALTAIAIGSAASSCRT